jgi:hypothetical protein
MNMTQPEFAHFVLTESETAARVIEAAGIKPQIKLSFPTNRAPYFGRMTQQPEVG